MDETRLAQLRDFIVEARKQGETYDVIRQQLLSSGWSDADVNEYLPTAWQQVDAAAAPAAPPPAAPPAVMPAAMPAQPPVAAPAQPPAYSPPVVAPVTPPVQPAYTPPSATPVSAPLTTAPPAYPAPAQPAYGTPVAYPPGYGAENTSGNPQAPVPPEVEAMGWSWGGFGLNWIWGLGNKVYIALLCLIPCVNLFVAIWLGISGHKMAWQNRRFDSFEQYKETMKKWNTWGIVVFCLSIVINIISAVVQFAMQSKAGS